MAPSSSSSSSSSMLLALLVFAGLASSTTMAQNIFNPLQHCEKNLMLSEQGRPNSILRENEYLLLVNRYLQEMSPGSRPFASLPLPFVTLFEKELAIGGGIDIKGVRPGQEVFMTAEQEAHLSNVCKRTVDTLASVVVMISADDSAAGFSSEGLLQEDLPLGGGEGGGFQNQTLPLGGGGGGDGGGQPEEGQSGQPLLDGFEGGGQDQPLIGGDQGGEGCSYNVNFDVRIQFVDDEMAACDPGEDDGIIEVLAGVIALDAEEADIALDLDYADSFWSDEGEINNVEAFRRLQRQLQVLPTASCSARQETEQCSEEEADLCRWGCLKATSCDLTAESFSQMEGKITEILREWANEIEVDCLGIPGELVVKIRAEPLGREGGDEGGESVPTSQMEEGEGGPEGRPLGQNNNTTNGSDQEGPEGPEGPPGQNNNTSGANAGGSEGPPPGENNNTSGTGQEGFEGPPPRPNNNTSGANAGGPPGQNNTTNGSGEGPEGPPLGQNKNTTDGAGQGGPQGQTPGQNNNSTNGGTEDPPPGQNNNTTDGAGQGGIEGPPPGQSNNSTNGGTEGPPPGQNNNTTDGTSQGGVEGPPPGGNNTRETEQGGVEGPPPGQNNSTPDGAEQGGVEDPPPGQNNSTNASAPKSVTVTSGFIVKVDEALSDEDLAVLNEAYANFIVTLVADTGTGGNAARRLWGHRRRLATLDEDSVEIYSVENVNCSEASSVRLLQQDANTTTVITAATTNSTFPSSEANPIMPPPEAGPLNATTANTELPPEGGDTPSLPGVCYQINVKYEVVLDDNEDSEALMEQFSVATRTGIDNEKLQESIVMLDPESPVSVEGSTEPPAPPAELPTENAGGSSEEEGVDDVDESGSNPNVMAPKSRAIVTSGFVVEADEALSQEDLATLNDAYTNFVIALVADFGAKSTTVRRQMLREQRRRLATLDEETIEIFAVQDVDCPESIGDVRMLQELNVSSNNNITLPLSDVGATDSGMNASATDSITFPSSEVNSTDLDTTNSTTKLPLNTTTIHAQVEAADSTSAPTDSTTVLLLDNVTVLPTDTGAADGDFSMDAVNVTTPPSGRVCQQISAVYEIELDNDDNHEAVTEQFSTATTSGIDDGKLQESIEEIDPGTSLNVEVATDPPPAPTDPPTSTTAPAEGSNSTSSPSEGEDGQGSNSTGTESTTDSLAPTAVTITSGFIVKVGGDLSAAELAILNAAYVDFIVTLAANEGVNSTRGRRLMLLAQRRRLATLDKDSIQIYNTEEAECLEPSTSTCQQVTGKYEVALDDGEDPARVQEEFMAATTDGIDNGQLQESILKKNPYSSLSVEGSVFLSEPPITTAAPTPGDINVTAAPTVDGTNGTAPSTAGGTNGTAAPTAGGSNGAIIEEIKESKDGDSSSMMPIIIGVVVTLLVLCVLAGGGHWFMQKNKVSEDTANDDKGFDDGEDPEKGDKTNQDGEEMEGLNKNDETFDQVSSEEDVDQSDADGFVHATEPAFDDGEQPSFEDTFGDTQEAPPVESEPVEVMEEHFEDEPQDDAAKDLDLDEVDLDEEEEVNGENNSDLSEGSQVAHIEEEEEDDEFEDNNAASKDEADEEWADEPAFQEAEAEDPPVETEEHPDPSGDSPDNPVEPVEGDPKDDTVENAEENEEEDNDEDWDDEENDQALAGEDSVGSTEAAEQQGKDVGQVDVDNDTDDDDVDDADDIDDASKVENATDVGEVGDADNIDDASEVDNATDADDIDDASEVDSATDADDIDDASEVDNATGAVDIDDASKVDNTNDVGEVGDTDDIDDASEVDNATDAGEVGDDVDGTSKVDSTSDVDEVDNTSGVGEVDNTSNVGNVDDADADEVDTTSDDDDTNSIGDAAYVDHTSGVDDADNVDNGDDISDGDHDSNFGDGPEEQDENTGDATEEGDNVDDPSEAEPDPDKDKDIDPSNEVESDEDFGDSDEDSDDSDGDGLP